MEPTSSAGVTERSLLHSARMHGSVVLALTLLSAFLFAQTIKSLKEYGYVGGGVSPSNVISVSGNSEVFVKPDMGEFTFTVTEEAETVVAVRDAVEGKTGAALQVLQDKGVDKEKDVKTVSYTLQPKYEFEAANCIGRYPCERKQVQKGFTLSQSILVKVRDLAKAGELIQAVTDKSVQNVGGLTFTVADDEAKRAEARKRAIEDARARAEQIAQDLGVRLVRVVGFYEEGVPVPMYREVAMDSAYGMAEKAVPPSLPSGENKIVANVTINYEIR